MADAAIRLEGVVKRFPGSPRPAVDHLSFDIEAGEVVVLVGPSGCGKTTTLKMINRLEEPTAGRIVVHGREISDVAAHELRRGIGYVIQQIGLFPHRTVADNIATVPRLLGWDRRQVAGRVQELAELVGLEMDMLRRYPRELSGGQQQRVGVARALAADPPVLLMDEPFGAVDPIVRARLQDELLALQAQVRKTIVLVTHDIDEAIKLGDRIALLAAGGVLAQYGTPDELLRAPADDFVRDFLGAEPGLKRLSLQTVGRLPLAEGPVVTAGTSAADAGAVMDRHRVDWVGLRNGTGLLGWLWRHEYGTDVAPRPFLVTVGPDSTLRAALDAIVSSQTHVAPVVQDDRYLGLLTLEALTTELVTDAS
jgi:osmoprotectant transport system ATP-binding protein